MARFLVAVLFSAVSVVVAADNVIISEFAASNSNGLRDEDGDSSDWIELFNPEIANVPARSVTQEENVVDINPGVAQRFYRLVTPAVP